jgi:hypothetical protein
MRFLVAALAFLISSSALAEAKVINRGIVLDPKGLIRPALIRDALAVLKSRSGLRKDRIAIVDFSKHSSEERFFLIDLRSGDVEAYRTAHGKGSDANHDGIADSFSNSFNSKASSLGSYAARGEYFGKYGLSLKLDGLDTSNRNAAGRKIVLHSADYATPIWLRRHGRLGRSFGCFVVDPTLVRHIVKKLKSGVLIYAAR